jgi:hypothetical protein
MVLLFAGNKPTPWRYYQLKALQFLECPKAACNSELASAEIAGLSKARFR